MFKYAVIFLIISLIAGAFGLTNVSQVAKRVSMVLFAMFFLVFLALIGFRLSGQRGDRPPRPRPGGDRIRINRA